MRSTAYLPRTPKPPIPLPTPLIPILLLCPHRRMTSLHLNALSAFPHHARSFFCLVAIWSRAASAPLIWLNSVLEEPSPTPRRNLFRLGRTTRTIPRTQKCLQLKRKEQRPRLNLRMRRLPTEGRGGPRGGSALYADNVRPIYILYLPIADKLRLAYTSLLRITTTLPPKEDSETKAEDAGEANHQSNDNSGSNNTPSGNAMSRLTAMVSRPLFTRGVSRNRTEQPTPSELERGNGATH